MTVLLIDGVGNRREMEIPRRVPEIHVPVITPIRSMVFYSLLDGPPVPCFEVARFVATGEESWPPVYRQVV